MQRMAVAGSLSNFRSRMRDREDHVRLSPRPFGGRGRSMVRVSFAVAIIAVIATTVGCTMCCHPYDYCGPVYDGQGRYATGCSRCARAGSIFAEEADAPMQISGTAKPAGGMAKQSSGMPARTASARVRTRTTPQRAPSTEVAGSERIVSVTDRAVDSPALAADSPAQPGKLSAEAAQPMPARGWTARRSTDETLR